jgi:hypothetical protein
MITFDIIIIIIIIICKRVSVPKHHTIKRRGHGSKAPCNLDLDIR